MDATYFLRKAQAELVELEDTLDQEILLTVRISPTMENEFDALEIETSPDFDSMPSNELKDWAPRKAFYDAYVGMKGRTMSLTRAAAEYMADADGALRNSISIWEGSVEDGYDKAKHKRLIAQAEKLYEKISSAL